MHSPAAHLCRAFIDRTRVRPDDTFAVVARHGTDATLRNGEVMARALAIGALVRTCGAAAGDVVAIVLEHGIDLYPAFLGCMIGGFVPTFLPPLTVKQDADLFRDAMAALFARIRPAAVLTSRASRAHAPAGAHALLILDDIGAFDGDAVATAQRWLDAPGDTAQQTAFLQHSSGTTGLKKGVMLSHATVIAHIARYADAIGAAAGDVTVSWLPLYHDMGLITGFLLPMVLGGVIVALDALEWVVRPTLLLDYAQRHRGSFIHLPDFAFHHLLRAARGGQSWDLHSLKAVIDCSEPCRAATFERFAARFGAMGLDRSRLRVCYAMAETVFAVSLTPPGHIVRSGGSAATQAFLSCGRPLPGVQIAIRDAAGDPVAAGEPGEICIRSATLFDGYFRQPDVTAGRLRDGWLATRDLGCIEAGELFVLGRVDDLLTVNGRSLFAHEVEDVLTALPGLAAGRALAGTAFDAQLGATRLLILVEPADAASDPRALESDVRRIVLAHTGLSPSAVHVLPRGFLVKSSSGKLARGQCWRKFAQSRAGGPA